MSQNNMIPVEALEIPFESRDYDNLIEDFVSIAGYNQKDAIQAASNIRNFEQSF